MRKNGKKTGVFTADIAEDINYSEHTRMRNSYLICLLIIVFSVASCTQCTECEYSYVTPSTLDTITGSDYYCGSNSLVKDWEEYYEEQIQMEAFLHGTTAQVNCTRSRKPQ